jgi:FtsH-binding integral membrane protein
MRKKTDFTIFFITLACCLFWMTAQFTNVYAWKFTGIIFELLSLPTLLTGIVCFLISCVRWARDNFRVHSINPWTILLVLVTVVLIWVINSLREAGKLENAYQQTNNVSGY